MAAVTVAALSACTPVVEMHAAPHATDPLCAEIILALPDDLANYDKVRTDAQATAAWKEPTGTGIIITARCGLEPPGPTPQACVQIDTGTSVYDWIEVYDPDTSVWTYVTYGRDPALEIVVSHTSSQPSVALIDAARALDLVEPTAHCI